MKLKVFVGWDLREDIACKVCSQSRLPPTHSTQVSVTPRIQSELRNQSLYTRDTDTKVTTEFSLTQFLINTLAGEEGYAIFVDCDFLFLTDIHGVLDKIDPSRAVSMVKNDYYQTDTNKMDGCIQHGYPRKNWSSSIAFNCAHPGVRSLTPSVVNSAKPSYLHRFGWLNDSKISELEKGWNFLEGWYPAQYYRMNAVHHTLGNPWFEHKEDYDFPELWLKEERQLKKNQKQKVTA